MSGRSLSRMLRKQALEVYDQKPFHERPVSATIGRAGGLPAMLLGTSAPLRPGASMESERLRALVRALRKEKELKDSALSLGSGRPLVSFRRIWKNDRLSTPGKLLGTALLGPWEVGAALRRADHYNPFSDMAVVYNDEPSILAHEMGHAVDFKQSSLPALYALSRMFWPMTLVQENRASRHGMRMLTEQELKDAKDKQAAAERLARGEQILTAGLGSYAAAPFAQMAPLAPLGGLVGGQLAGRAARPFTRQTEGLKEKVDKHRPDAGSAVLGVSAGLGLAAAGLAAAIALASLRHRPEKTA